METVKHFFETIGFENILKVYGITASAISIVITGFTQYRKQKNNRAKENFDLLKDSLNLELSKDMKGFFNDSFEDELFYKITKIRAQGAKRLALIELHKKVNFLFDWSQIKELYQYIDFSDNGTKILIKKFDERFLIFTFYFGLAMLIIGMLLAYISSIVFNIYGIPFVIIGGFIAFYGYYFMRPKFALNNAKKIQEILVNDEKNNKNKKQIITTPNK